MKREKPNTPRASLTLEALSALQEYEQRRARQEEMHPKVKEGNIRTALKARVEAYGGEVRAVAWLGRKNAPDVLTLFPHDSAYGLAHFASFCHPFIETKRPGKGATEAQAREHERMREAGCVVLVITTIEELDAWLAPL